MVGGWKKNLDRDRLQYRRVQHFIHRRRRRRFRSARIDRVYGRFHDDQSRESIDECLLLILTMDMTLIARRKKGNL